jgi:hypothetical protein
MLGRPAPDVWPECDEDLLRHRCESLVTNLGDLVVRDRTASSGQGNGGWMEETVAGRRIEDARRRRHTEHIHGGCGIVDDLLDLVKGPGDVLRRVGRVLSPTKLTGTACGRATSFASGGAVGDAEDQIRVAAVH